MRVLVTGGAGFIGLWIARRLLRLGVEVRAYDLVCAPPLATELLDEGASHIEWHQGDIADAEAVLSASEGCEALVHLAALLTPACQGDPGRGARVNLLGTLNVFEAARARGIDTVLYMSSAGVFGPDDGHTPRPTTHYGAFKLAGEGCARAYALDHGIRSAGFRPLVVYGPGREVGLTAGPTLACRAVARGEPFTLDYTGDSDYVFVDDVAAAFEAALTAPPAGAEVYNITGEKASTDALLQTLRGIVPDARLTARGPTLPVSAAIEDGALREVFPQVPRTRLTEGLGLTVDHYRSH